MRRCILHVDMDAFFAAVEQRDRPELKGVPVVVGAPPDKRGVVSTCSYAARAFGIRSAMPSREAWRRCPHAVFLPPDFPRYEAASARIFSILSRFSPWVEPLSIDEAFMDVTGSRALFGTGEEIGRQIRAAIRDEVGLTASVGVAHNKFLAKLASEQAKPDGLRVVPVARDAVIQFLAPLPVGALWGVGRVTAATLEAAGWRRIVDIQRAEPSRLRQILGPALAAHLSALAVGDDAREVETEFEEKSLSREQTFEEDCRNPDVARDALKNLADDVGRRLREHGRHATAARIKVRWADFRTITRQAAFESAVCDDFALRAMALRLFGALSVAQPVRLIGFGVMGLRTGPCEQLSLFDATAGSSTREKRERLCRAVDQLRRRMGPDAVVRISTVAPTAKNETGGDTI